MKFFKVFLVVLILTISVESIRVPSLLSRFKVKKPTSKVLTTTSTGFQFAFKQMEKVLKKGELQLGNIIGGSIVKNGQIYKCKAFINMHGRMQPCFLRVDLQSQTWFKLCY